MLFADIANEMVMVDQISQHWLQVFPDKLLQMPYERIVTDLKSAAEDMLAHCALPWDDNVLHFHQNQRTVQTASLAQVCCASLLALGRQPVTLCGQCSRKPTT